MRTYVNQYTFVPGNGPAIDPELRSESMTEPDGYRTTEEIVNELILAGERLDKYRREEYDFDDNEEVPDEMPITRYREFDAATASQVLESEARRIASLPPNAQVNPAVAAAVVAASAAAAEARVSEAK